MSKTRAMLAFLAARFPAAYAAGIVAERVTRGGAVDEAVGAAEAEELLRQLAARGLVRGDANPIDGLCVWSATQAGCEAWTLDGRMNGG
jgi:hypothetical protein